MRTEVLLKFGFLPVFLGAFLLFLVMANSRKKVLAIRKNLLTAALTL